MAGKEGLVPSRITGIVQSIILLGSDTIERVDVKLDSGAEIKSPPRFGIKINKGDLVYVSPRIYASKLPSKGGVYDEYEDPHARWVMVVRGEKIVTRFDVPSRAIRIDSQEALDAVLNS